MSAGQADDITTAAAGEETPGNDDELRLEVPASGRSVRYARLLAGAVADEAGFDYEEVEDLRIAVNELTFVLLEAGEPSGPLTLRIFCDDDRTVVVEARCELRAAHAPGAEPGDLMLKIIAAVVDSFDLDISSGYGAYRLRKSRRGGPTTAPP
jgi:anti-sigma regulatory factor (Ser/Thr protein kinase)